MGRHGRTLLLLLAIVGGDSLYCEMTIMPSVSEPNLFRCSPGAHCDVGPAAYLL
ncbi:unnamed protein product [Musa acuminata subsp. malaccensis]|nr:unnamed protein product [Musa acuminata subsp. malaccensis]